MESKFVMLVAETNPGNSAPSIVNQNIDMWKTADCCTSEMCLRKISVKFTGKCSAKIRRSECFVSEATSFVCC